MPDTPLAQRYVLWGSAGHAKVLASAIALRGGQVIALFDNREVPSALEGVPVFVGREGFAAWKAGVADLSSVAGLAAIGGARGNDRLEVLQLFASHGLALPALVHPQACVDRGALLGAGTQVLALGLVAAGARVGRGCIINHRALVDHECSVGDGAHLAPAATLCGCVVVGDRAFIGAGAVVLPRLRIGADAVVGAGAVVTRDVPAGATVTGNPARARAVT